MTCTCPTGERDPRCQAHAGEVIILRSGGVSTATTHVFVSATADPWSNTNSDTVLAMLSRWVRPRPRRFVAPPPPNERVRRSHLEGARFGWADAPRRPCYRAVRTR